MRRSISLYHPIAHSAMRKKHQTSGLSLRNRLRRDGLDSLPTARTRKSAGCFYNFSVDILYHVSNTLENAQCQWDYRLVDRLKAQLIGNLYRAMHQEQANGQDHQYTAKIKQLLDLVCESDLSKKVDRDAIFKLYRGLFWRKDWWSDFTAAGNHRPRGGFLLPKTFLHITLNLE